ncbi:hypothetical protein D3C87_1106780 [compost metagenome]
MQAAHGKAGGRLPLALRNRLNAAAPDFRKEGSGPEDKRHASRKPGRNINPEETEAEKSDEKLHKQRGALKDFDIDAGSTVQSPARADAQPQKHDAHHTAADEGNER